VTDSEGRRYIDASGGAAVSCLGHSHPAVIAAIREQVGRLPFVHSSFFTNEPAEALASFLIERAPEGFALYTGDDMTTAAFLLLGGHGAISVTANVAPRLMHEMCAAAMAGDAITARDINRKLLWLHRNLFCEANPIPVKWAVQQMGLIEGGIRLPLTPLSEAFHERVREAMRRAGIQA